MKQKKRDLKKLQATIYINYALGKIRTQKRFSFDNDFKDDNIGKTSRLLRYAVRDTLLCLKWIEGEKSYSLLKEFVTQKDLEYASEMTLDKYIDMRKSEKIRNEKYKVKNSVKGPALKPDLEDLMLIKNDLAALTLKVETMIATYTTPTLF